MKQPRTCRCLLCHLELQFLQQVTEYPGMMQRRLLASQSPLASFATPGLLLAHLRETEAGPHSDAIFQELLGIDDCDSAFVQSLFVLAFLPMIHRVIRQITRYQPHLSTEDITQQALYSLLQTLQSRDIHLRRSHIAFCISRAVKRQTYRWAVRQSLRTEKENEAADILAAFVVEEPFEKHAMLRHFLHRCVTQGWIDDTDVDLLVQFKLDGCSGEDLASSAGISSNALRQRMKRLLAKLRRLAQSNSHLG